MDRGGVKRPRSGTPETSNKKKDKLKKKKKNKSNTKKSDGGEDNSNSLESTATMDGQYMAKILSTFSKMEQSRFEAFKRVSFPSNAISRYVAHCLAERQQPQRQLHEATNPNAKKVFAANPGSEPQLQDLVVPGQEEEITTVVATLAKVYAQRLCAAAKTCAQVQKQQQQQQQAGGGTTSSGDTGGAIQPEHMLQAFHARKQQGQDPGFFLQPNEMITIAAHHDVSGKEQMKRTAALAAQEVFDKTFDDYKEFLKRNPPKPADAAAADDDAAAADAGTTEKKEDDDSDSGDEDEVDLDLEAEMEKDMEE